MSLSIGPAGIAARPVPHLFAPQLHYTLTVDPSAIDIVQVAIAVRGMRPSFLLAMKVHAEYDAGYWRYLDSMRLEGAAGASGVLTREDSTLWRVSLPGGNGVIHYRVRIQPAPPGLRRAWRPYASDRGVLINPPDFFLYPPEFPSVPSTVELRIPSSWHVATALASQGTATRRSAPDAVTLLDSPILAGTFREWSFTDHGTTYHVVYWPMAGAAAFDTARFVEGLRRIAGSAAAVLGRPPSDDYWFLIQDGASDALEHRGSVTIGVPSERLARDPWAATTEITHEFIHAWNLVAARPAGYNDLSYRPPSRTPSLWIGEGITLYYADLLSRRAGMAERGRTRLDHLGDLLQRYYSLPAMQRVSPERSSLAFGDSPADNPDATGGYYLQGELLGGVIDAVVRDSSHERHGLDDVMRAMVARGAQGTRGYTAPEFERVTDSVCGCRLDSLFAKEVRGPGPVDVSPVLGRLGLRLTLDSIAASDDSGHAVPDRRLRANFREGAPPRLVMSDSSTAWARAGLRTGDELLAVDQVAIGSFGELQAQLRQVHLGTDRQARVTVDVRRGGDSVRVPVTVGGYQMPRVRFADVAALDSTKRARRDAWLKGITTPPSSPRSAPPHPPHSRP